MSQWFEKENYDDSSPVPEWMRRHETLSLIRVYGDGRTQPGWGSKQFLINQQRNAFNPDRAIKFYEKYSQPFAFVMRSVPYFCVDIDGKNDGIRTAGALQLTKTAAEISKSGDGYHIFYDMPGTLWDPLYGFNEFPDFNGLIPGVDIRGTGAVYHYHSQRWNGREPAPMPESLAKLIGKARDIKRMARASKVSNMSPEDMVILHDELKMRLEKPIRKGQRNAELYKLGCRMYMAGYPAWDVEITKRGIEVGLEESELDELVRHIEQYA